MPWQARLKPNPPPQEAIGREMVPRQGPFAGSGWSAQPFAEALGFTCGTAAPAEVPGSISALV